MALSILLDKEATDELRVIDANMTAIGTLRRAIKTLGTIVKKRKEGYSLYFERDDDSANRIKYEDLGE